MVQSTPQHQNLPTRNLRDENVRPQPAPSVRYCAKFVAMTKVSWDLIWQDETTVFRCSIDAYARILTTYTMHEHEYTSSTEHGSQMRGSSSANRNNVVCIMWLLLVIHQRCAKFCCCLTLFSVINFYLRFTYNNTRTSSVDNCFAYFVRLLRYHMNTKFVTMTKVSWNMIWQNETTVFIYSMYAYTHILTT